MTEGVAPYDWQLRVRFADQWAQDPAFRRALSALYARHCRTLPDALARAVRAPLLDRDVPAFADAELSEVEALTEQDPWSGDLDADAARWAEGYLASIARMGGRYGLRRWDPPRDGRTVSYGEFLIHRWCTHRAGYGMGPERFAWSVGAEAYFIPPRTRPLDVTWDPRHEPYDEARRRLRTSLDLELAAIRSAWDASPAGFAFRVPGNAGRDLAWLYKRVRLRRTVPEIVADEGWDADSAPMVQVATKAMAKRLGVDLS